MKTNPSIAFYTSTLVAMMGTLLMGLVYYETSHSFYQQILREQESRMRVAWDCLRQKGVSCSIRNGKLYAGNFTLSGDSEVVDRITSLVGGTATIFLGDKRVATNIRLPDGSRAVGTQWMKSEASQTVLQRGENYRGEVTILGEPYFTAYEPIRDAHGNVIGALQVGTKREVYSKSLNQILLRTLSITLASAALIGFFVYTAFRRLAEEVAILKGRESQWKGIEGSNLAGVSQKRYEWKAEIK
jgi:methyl-accepting chemotaxis protein